MSATPAEAGRWLGIEDEDLADMVEHPAVCRALIEVREIYNQWEEDPAEDFDSVMRHSGLRPEQIFARHDLPVVDPDGLDVRKLKLELGLLRSGTGEVVQERKLYGMTAGRLEKAERRVVELRLRAEQSINLLEGASRALNDDGERQTQETSRRRIEQAIENLRGGLEASGGDTDIE